MKIRHDNRVKKYWQGILKERENFWSSFFIKYQDEDNKEVDFRSYMDNSSTRINNLLGLAAEEKESEVSESSDKKVLQYFEEAQSSETSNEVTTSLNENQEQDKVENLKPGELSVVALKKIVPTLVLEAPKSVNKLISGSSNGSDFTVLQNFEEQSSESSETNSDEVTTPLNGDQEEQKVENVEPVNLPVVLMQRVVPLFVLEVNLKEEKAKYLLSRNSYSAKKFKLFESSLHPKENVEDTSMIDDEYTTFSVHFNSKFLNESIASTASEFNKIIYRRIKPKRKHVSNPKRFKLM